MPLLHSHACAGSISCWISGSGFQPRPMSFAIPSGGLTSRPVRRPTSSVVLHSTPAKAALLEAKGSSRRRLRCRSYPYAPRGFLARLCSVGLLGLELRRFLRSSARPLRQSFRINLKASTDVLQRLRGGGWGPFRPVPWCADGFLLEERNAASALGRSQPHLLGEIYGQETSSMLPAEALRAALLSSTASSPNAHSTHGGQGHFILDLCAAPGSKSTQLAAWLSDIEDSLLVVNEPDLDRARALRTNLIRSGAENCLVTRTDGRKFGKLAEGVFDAVLVDAPCSAEGNVRRHPEVLDRWVASQQKEQLLARTDVQWELLLSGWHALRPGGVLVYSTCTLCPHENEEQCRRLLEFGEQGDGSSRATIVDLGELLGFPRKVESGVTEEGFLRIWPHNFDTEGFFVACFRKVLPGQANLPDSSRTSNVADSITSSIRSVTNCLPATASSSSRIKSVCASTAQEIQASAEKQLGFWVSSLRGQSMNNRLVEDVDGAIWLLPCKPGPHRPDVGLPDSLVNLAPYVQEPGVCVARRQPATSDFQISDELLLLAGHRASVALTNLKQDDWLELVAKAEGSMGAWCMKMDACASRGDIIASRDVLKGMLTARLQPDSVSYNTLLKAYARAGDLVGARGLLEEMKSEGVEPGLFSFNMLIEILADGGDGNGALAILEEMGKKRVEPDLVTYNTLIKARVRDNDLRRAEELLGTLQDQRLSPNVVTYNTLLRGIVGVTAGSRGGSLASSERRAAGVARAERLLGEMRRSAVLPDLASSAALAQVKAVAGDRSGARQLLAQLQAAKKEGAQEGSTRLDMAACNALIEAYAAAEDLRGAEGILWEAQAAGLQPDLVSLNTLLKAKARAGDTVAAERLLEEMPSCWGLQPDLFSYNTLLEAWARATVRDTVSGAQGVLVTMGVARVEPDLVSYNTLVKALAGAGKVAEAETLIRQVMPAKRLNPDLVSYTTLLKAHANAAKPSRPSQQNKQKNEDTNSSGSELGSLSLPAVSSPGKALLSGSIVQSDFEAASQISVPSSVEGAAAAESVFEEMMSSRLTPDLVSYTTLLHACGRSGDHQRSERWVRIAEEQGLQVGVIGYGMLLHACAIARNPDLAESWLEAMPQKRIVPDLACMNTVLLACCKAGQPGRAEQRLREMAGGGGVGVTTGPGRLQPDKVSFSTVARGYTDVGDDAAASRLREELRLSSRPGTATSPSDQQNMPKDAVPSDKRGFALR
ncbi:unnamed protein product [Polarella glacialis]|uniref:SAM-dependent MTase RsmB/NOP-type domain-containing protein n=1 Tax=Polarella glacialis TaxID=89957 RepID=A0A813HJN2_POLGL|nr:unnamed protein product [Polarella glacialis]